MRKAILPIVLVAVLVAVAFLLRGGSGGGLPETPEAAVNAFFDAAGQGDDAAYLRLTTGEFRDLLRQARKEAGPERFRENIRQSVAGLKGLATERREEAPGGLQVLEVDLVFADRNEKQRVVVQQQGSGWAIASVEQARMEKPPIPYGTPVFDVPEKQ